MCFFRRKLSSAELSRVKDMLEQAQSSAQAINTTINPEVFFYNLHQTLDLLLALRTYEKYKIFVGRTPSEDYRKIVGNLDATVNDFIDRYVRSNPLFVDAPLSYYFDKAHTLWPGVYFLWPDCPNYPHYIGPLYTKGNYKRAKSIVRPIREIPCGDGMLPSESKLFAEIAKCNAEFGYITDDLYQRLREFQVSWLERKYDFNSLAGIESIPVSCDLPGAPLSPGAIGGATGEVYYYLRHRAYKYEEAGNRELALACMRKSAALAVCRGYFTESDCYPLVRMLARFGHINEARQKKREFDALLGISVIDDSIIEYERRKWEDWKVVQWLQENFPDKAPKNVTGYRRMKTQNTKNYQQLKSLAAQKGKEI